MFTINQTIVSVLCCKCGISMQPNAANMCVKCLGSEVDISEGLLKQVILVHCPACDRFFEPPKSWYLLSDQLDVLNFCLKKLEKNRKSNKVILIDAGFIPTDPNSKRMLVEAKIWKEVVHGAILEKSYTVEYVLQEHMCAYCSRIQANPDQGVAAVKLRQQIDHRPDFFYLEQLIRKHGAATSNTGIKQMKKSMDKSMDFFFSNQSHAVKFVDFVGKVAPIRTHLGKQLVSHDTMSNNFNYKYTFSVEISPICHGDLICLPPNVSSSLGNLGPLVICTDVTNSIALLDPFSLRHCVLDADQYWRVSFEPLLTALVLAEYIVLDVKIVSPDVFISGTKYALADAEVGRLTINGRTKKKRFFSIRTHLGHHLSPGDIALGYDFRTAFVDDIELKKYRGLVLPEAILIKTWDEDLRQHRTWRRLFLDTEEYGQENMKSEYVKFLNNLEENPEMRFCTSLYPNREYQPSEMESATHGEDVSSVPLEEQLADLNLSNKEDQEDIMIE